MTYKLNRAIYITCITLLYSFHKIHLNNLLDNAHPCRNRMRISNMFLLYYDKRRIKESIDYKLLLSYFLDSLLGSQDSIFLCRDIQHQVGKFCKYLWFGMFHMEIHKINKTLSIYLDKICLGNHCQLDTMNCIKNCIDKLNIFVKNCMLSKEQSIDHI